MSAAPQPVQSPYARACADLATLGYHAIPIMPLEKAPGEYKGGRWLRMREWQRFRDRAPSDFERGLWSRNMPEANVGIVLGSPAGDGLRLVAVDIDTMDPDAFADIASALPYSPMVKRGAKGETRFYRAPVTIKSKPYDDTRNGGRSRLLDLLTGQDTRQTVVPPSVHVSNAGEPSGHIYAWLAGPVPANSLPVFDADALTELEETLETWGWNARAREAPAARTTELPDEDDYFTATKVAALNNLPAWVPDLDLYDCRPARGGYEAVATWRPSSTGRPIADRKRNLSIQAVGIKDFGTNDTYSAIDLVMAARGVDRGEAVEWLRGRLGFTPSAPVLLLNQPAPITTVQEWHEEAKAPIVAPEPAPDELPDALTHIPGLLGHIVDWICDTAIYPQRALALGAAVTIVGTAAGRKYGGPTRTGTQLYVMALAGTGAGKDHAYKAIPRVLTAAGMQAHIGPGYLMSISALVSRVTRTPLSLCAMDEFGAFMAKMKNKRGSTHEQAMPGYLRTLWSSSFATVPPIEWANKDSAPIHSPCLSIYGVSTHEEFYEALGGGDISNGFLNRFLLISTRRKPREVDPELDPFVVPDHIKHGLQAIYGSGSGLATATSHAGQADPPLITAAWADASVKAIYDDLRRAVQERPNESFFARTAETAQRLATIRAVGQCASAPVITAEDMIWARDLALWSAEKMIAETGDHISENENEANAKRLLRIIADHAEGISKRDLGRKLKKLKGRELDDLLKFVVMTEEVIVVQRQPPSGGTPTIIYRRMRG